MYLQDGSELPMHAEPHDTLRLGLSALKDDAAVSHPVESIQNNVRYPQINPRSKDCAVL